jgi:hypothetical protein
MGFTPDGRLWGCMSDTVYCWDFPEGRGLKSWSTTPVNLLPPNPAVEALAPGRRGVLVGAQTGRAWLLRAEDGAVVTVGSGWTFPTNAALDAVAWNADELRAAFGNHAGEVYIAPGGGEKPLRLAAHRDIVTGLAFDPKGMLASGGRRVARPWRPDGDGYREALRCGPRARSRGWPSP